MDVQQLKRTSANHHQHGWKSNIGSDKIRAKDIVFTKGGLFDKHPGNLRYRTIVHSFMDEYKSTTEQQRRSEEVRIAQEIIATVKRYGGRFVTFTSKLDQWEEIPIRLARKKVLHTLREAFDSCSLEELH